MCAAVTMQTVLFVCFCVLGAFVSIETKPWCGQLECSNRRYGSNGGYDYGGKQTEEVQSSRFRYNSQRGYQVDSYYRGGNRGGGQTEYGGGGGEYSGGGFVSGVNRGAGYGAGRRYYDAFVPQDCPNCRINSFGNGFGNTNTFNLPNDIYV